MKPLNEWTEEERQQNRNKWGVPNKLFEEWVDGVKVVDEWGTHLSACKCFICEIINKNTKKKING